MYIDADWDIWMAFVISYAEEVDDVRWFDAPHLWDFSKEFWIGYYEEDFTPTEAVISQLNYEEGDLYD